MEFLSANCFIFLIIAILAFAVMIFNQLMRFALMAKNIRDHRAGSDIAGFFKGIVVFVLSGFIASVSSLLFIIGLIIRLTA